MRAGVLSAFFALVINFIVNAQIKSDEVLFTVGESSVLASEFLRVYNKNLDLVKDESQKDVDEYLKLFINYKLKLAEARTLDFHKKPQYIRELNGYKKQLAKNYLTDHEVTEALVKEAYDRISYDVLVRHVLIRMDPSEKDTLAIYNKMLSYRDKLKNENFNKVQQELHNGGSVLVEDLGYFSGFKMVYDFETVAFNTEVGDVSMPFRTQFGYHVLKVYDKRKSRGEVTVGHIMIANNQKDTNVDPQERINEISKLLEQGENFESLAKQFSDDKSSAGKGGKLAPFKTGQLSSTEFEDMAFSLINKGDVTTPFQTAYGWHIIKLYDKRPLGSFDEMQYELENMVKRDSRSKLINTSLLKKLRTQYDVTDENPNKAYFVNALNEDFYNRKWRIPEDMEGNKVFATIGTKKLTYKEFAGYLRSQQKGAVNKKPFNKIVDEAYTAFLDRHLLLYHEENLENVNEEFANILNEYREGLLLFDLMETKIWNSVKKDTSGLENYYNAHKNQYMWKERADAIIATASKEKDIKEVRRLLKKGEGVEAIKKKLNTEDQQRVIFTAGEIDKDHQALPKDYSFTKGVSDVYFQNDTYLVVQVNDIRPESVKTLEEAKGLVISDYQEYVEKEWLEELKERYKVKVNKQVLSRVKNQIGK